MTISQLKEHSLKVHGKALTLPRPRIVSLLSSHSHHSSQKATPAEEVEDSNGKMGWPAKMNHFGLRWAGISCQPFFPEENLMQKHGSSEGRNVERLKQYRNWSWMVLQTLGASVWCQCLWAALVVESAQPVGGLMLDSSPASKTEDGIPDVYIFVYLFAFYLLLKNIYVLRSVWGVTYVN